MIVPEKPTNESQRSAALKSYNILDTLPEDDYDGLTRLAAAICGTPVALISLVDDDRQWFKSTHNFPYQETPRDVAFCAHNILDPTAPLVVEDASKDERFAANPLVTGAPHIAFYAGVPIVEPSGQALGSLCVIDREARQLTEQQLQALQDLARQVVNLLVLRKARDRTTEAYTELVNMLDQSPVAIATIVRDGLTFTNANVFYGELVGRAPEQIIGKPLLDALPELRGQGFDNLLRGVLDTGIPFTADEVEVNLIRNGRPERIYVNLAYKPMRNDAQEIYAVLVVATDVTAQVVSRNAIQESAARFRTLIEEAPMATCLFVGRELRVEVANSLMFDIWSKGDRVIGKTLPQILPELADQPFLKILDDVYTSGRSFTGTGMPADVIQNGVRETRYYDFTYKPLRNEAGDVYAILHVATDVTERALSRQQLEDAEANLRAAIELAQLATWSIDLTTGQMTHSPRLHAWLGLPEQTGPLDWLPLVQAHDRQRIADALHAALGPAGTGSFDEVFAVSHARTGQQRILHASGQTTFDAAGNVRSVSGISQDVTAQQEVQLALSNEVRNRTEELERANAQLLHSNEELAQYAYVASHDLQEPLRKIQVFSGLLQKDQNLSEKSANLVGKIGVSSERMSLLIHDLLQFSRLLKSDAPYRSVDLNDVVRSVYNDFELLAAEKEAQLRCGPLPVIEAVGLQMNQLFYNLVSNSLKFTRPGVAPEVSITARILAPSEVRERVVTPLPFATYHEICVADNGIGFEAQYADQIFEVFKRLHTRDTYPGSGIGLALCRRIVTNHGGALSSQSNEGHGATFCMVLPDRQREASAELQA